MMPAGRLPVSAGPLTDVYKRQLYLSDGSAVVLSTKAYYTPEGKSLANVGIEPDVSVDLSDEDYYKPVSYTHLRMYRVIYDCINEIEAAMKGLLAPKFKEVVIGHAEVRQVYKVSKVGTVCGCYVQDGKIVRNCGVRLVRDGIVIHEGELASLRRFKDDVKEVQTNFECGLSIEKFNDIKEGDIVEAFVMEQIQE